MLKRKLVLTAAIILICLLLAACFFTVKTHSQSDPLNEPANLADIVEFPSSTSTQSCSVNLTDPYTVGSNLLGKFMGYVDGTGNIINELAAEGATISNAPPYYALYGGTDQCVNFTGTINTISFSGFAWGWWTNSFHGPPGFGNQTALFVEAFDTVSHKSIVVSAVTNLCPPNHAVPGLPGTTIVNAMPFVYANFTFWAGSSWGNPSPREVSWYYWQYGSNYNPNWFWGVYLWWRNYLKSYRLTYQAWYWWFWHWYYTEFWYYWGASLPY